MAKVVNSAPSSTASGYSVPRASRPAAAKPFDGGKPVAHRHIDKFNPGVKTMQQRMRSAGIDTGPIDGKKGPLTRAAMAKYHARFGSSAADGLKVDPSFAEHAGKVARNADALSRREGKRSNLDLPGAPAAPAQPGGMNPAPDAPPAAPGGAPATPGNVDAGATKDGHSLPSTGGKATTFWNGAYQYKGRRDTDNMSTGAWGDSNKPTDYFAAIPVGLSGGGNWWHNKKLLVTNPANGQQVVVPVQDKGPHPKTGAAIDLSPVAKEALGVGFMDNLNVKISFAADDAPIGPVR